ncbi:hypothetical protein [Phreatobacter stygius]|uniref:Uncharacterized protein n=1 Tax=Phreatobacter stygius TaxID=1940610 RepID=A0A4D7BAE2_9HYPH|nr:hypothetical protein [Phreatobacter stygius]QCI67765.1 hypothetical protein E8M01_28205 [Phreatobacter stygius]
MLHDLVVKLSHGDPPVTSRKPVARAKVPAEHPTKPPFDRSAAGQGADGPAEPIGAPSVGMKPQEDTMTSQGKSLADRKADDMQAEGTREFEAAIAGAGPAMPAKQAGQTIDKGLIDKDLIDKDLHKALEDTFPASDPVAATSAETKPGAPSKPRRDA